MNAQMTSSQSAWAWRLGAALTGLLSATAIYLWWILLSPWGYALPADYSVAEGPCDQRVFVYGTLRNPLVRGLIVQRRVPAVPAAVAGFEKQQLNMQPVADGRVPGEVFVVESAELKRLDRYERLGVRYERVCLALESGEPVWVYRRLPV